MSDYLDLSDRDFDAFFRGLNRYVAQKCDGPIPEWTHIPASARKELGDSYGIWDRAYQKTTAPHTPVDTEAKNEAKSGAKGKIRPFVNLYLREDQPAVTNMDRMSVGIPNKDKIPSRLPVPEVKPDTEAIPYGKGRHRVTALNPQTGAKQKPPLVKGVAFAHRLRNPDTPKSAAEDMPSEFQAKTMREFQWSEGDYGKVCDYACAYENAGGKRGPWSDVTSLIIS